MYHLVFDPPKKEGVCDTCGGELYQRADDQEKTIRERLKVYDKQTAPLIQYYRGKGLLRAIDGVGGVEEIFQRIVKAIGK
jgi:adenylate kinase